MKVTVRKIPLEDILGVLVLMREANVEFVNFECDMNPTQDNVNVAPYICIDPNQQSLEIKRVRDSEDQMNQIKTLMNGDKC
jgi:hypothetical protein